MLINVFVSTVTGALTVCGLSILVSTWSRRARDALRLIYGLLFIMVITPPTIAFLAFVVGIGANWRPLVFAMNMLNPVNVLGVIIPIPIAAPAIWMTWLCQSIFGCACIAISTLTLRSASRKLNEAPTRGRGALKTLGESTRGPIEDYPMWWKEQGRRRPRIEALLVFVAILSGVALAELMQAWTWNKDDFLGGIVGVSTLVLCAAALLANARCAMSVTGEKERQCWDTLLSTTLTPDEIVLAKVAGGMHAIRYFVLFTACLWLVAAFYDARALVPLVLQTGTFLLIGPFAAAIGLWFSFGSGTSTAAALKSLVLLLFVGGGYMFVLVPVLSGSVTGREIVLTFTGVIPFHLAFSGLTYHWKWAPTSNETYYIITACTVGVIGYAVASVVLVGYCIFSFERWTGRSGRGAGRRSSWSDAY